MSEWQKQWAAGKPGALTEEDRAKLNRWLAAIGENDTELIKELFLCCERDPEARAFFLERAGEPFPDSFPDQPQPNLTSIESKG